MLSKNEKEVKAGDTFVVEVAASVTVDSVRAHARNLYGRELHIRAKIGPWRVEGRERRCAIEAIDDEVLVGSVSSWPQPDCVIYVGHFK